MIQTPARINPPPKSRVRRQRLAQRPHRDDDADQRGQVGEDRGLTRLQLAQRVAPEHEGQCRGRRPEIEEPRQIARGWGESGARR